MTKKQFARSILGASCEVYASKAEWYKHGGHAGTNMLARVIARAKKVGFKAVSVSSDCVPDGSVVSDGAHFKDKAGNVLIVRSSYGCVASDNSFLAELKFAKE